MLLLGAWALCASLRLAGYSVLASVAAIPLPTCHFVDFPRAPVLSDWRVVYPNGERYGYALPCA